MGCVTQKSESTETASPHASPRRGGWLSLLRLLPQSQPERSPTYGFQLVPAAKISLKSLSFAEIQPNALSFKKKSVTLCRLVDRSAVLCASRKPATTTKRAFRAFILSHEIAKFKAEGCLSRQRPRYVSYAYGSHAAMLEHIRRGVSCFQFISAMVFGDTSHKMS